MASASALGSDEALELLAPPPPPDPPLPTAPVIENAAKEPEVVDLANYLSQNKVLEAPLTFVSVMESLNAVELTHEQRLFLHLAAAMLCDDW